MVRDSCHLETGAGRGQRGIGPGLTASDPVRVLFIGGYGRSGSTLLQRLLGEVRGAVAVGEVRHIWERGYGQDHLCGCGERFSSCPFWTAVTREAYGSLPPDEAAAVFRLKRLVERPRRAHQVRFGLAGPTHRRRLARYGRILTRLYRAIRDVSGADLVVDATKDPTHGFVLARLPGIELHTVHLVRDSRATAHSWQRRRIRPEIHWDRRLMPRRGSLDAAVRWSAANFLTEFLRSQGGSYGRWRYEELAATPQATVREMLAGIGWSGPPPELPFLEERTARLGTAHTVSGNPQRFDTGAIDLHVDDEWRRAMPTADRLLVTAVSAPLLVRYGYPLLPETA